MRKPKMAERAIGAVVLSAILLTTANRFFNWGLFGANDKIVQGIVVYGSVMILLQMVVRLKRDG
jgi:hypothetical protein